MAIAYPLVSFLCAIILAAFIPVRRIRTSVPNLAIVLWLVGYNIVHGINAIVWAGNVDIRVPVWCDITTKFMLGANIALPGALICIAGELEHLSSSRTFPSDKKAIRNRTILEHIFCYVIPLLYMLLHLVAQDHRFDLVRDLGCSASIHPSMFAFLIIWIPPLVFCSITFIFSAIAIHHACRVASAQFAVYLDSRSSMDSSIFIRRLTICMVMTGTLSLISVFSLFSAPVFVPWVSWDVAHAQISKVDVVANEDDINTVKLAWWGLFVESILYILLCLVLGEETRDAFRWIAKETRKKRELPKLPKLILPMYSKKATPQMTAVSRSNSLTQPQPLPHTLELKSGWDDMLDGKAPKRRTSSKRSKRSTSPTVCTSPTPSSQSKDDDKAFIDSTLSYLGSPTAKSLGLSSPIEALPARHSSPKRPALAIPPKPSSPPPSAPTSPILVTTTKPIRTDVPPENITSVLEVSWPVPPDSPVPSLAPSRHSSRQSRARSQSRSGSPTSSVEGSQFGYPLYPTVTPPHLRTRPFIGSSISSISDISSPVSPSPPTPVKSILKRPSIKGIRRSWSKERVGTGYPAEVIHMTVVQETV